MRPITFTEKEVQVLYLGLDIIESAWEMHSLMGHTKPQPEANKAALDGIRGKLAEAAVQPWDGRAQPPEGDEDGFLPDSVRGN